LETSIDKQTDIYEKLADIAAQIRAAIDRSDDGAIGELLERKRDIISDLKPVAETTARLREQLAGHSEVPGDLQARASDAVGRARGALEALLGLELANEEALRAVTGSIRAELVEIGRGRRLLEGYRGSRETDPLFMDKRR
jgi:hypothetical protein